ncbi:hypothetical protein RJ640_019844 [Escallonia rubra]|uniref:Uncharacterized protein n=1 Tax=Escallonia rubra TaxID=112253 RepID=A0AA88RRE0_9ASTE|nr:hypothetical protein RJ640_019844 [Escallonia rubra]
MGSLLFVLPTATAPNYNYGSSKLAIGTPPTLEFRGSSRKACSRFVCLSNQGPDSYLSPQVDDGEEDPQDSVQELRVPNRWLSPSKALEESEWLRVTLRKWLDDEYCPEPTNVEISKVAAHSYYKCLVEKQTDLGEILLKMARELESISYQESFHGAFSSANAAVTLISQRIELD